MRVLARLHLWGGIGEGGLYLPGSPLPLSTSVLVCLLLDFCPKLAEISVGDPRVRFSLPSFSSSRSSGSVGIPLDDGISKRNENLNVLIWVVGIDLEVLIKRWSMTLILVA